VGQPIRAGPQFEGEATPGNLASKTTYVVLKEPGVADLNSSLKILIVCLPLPEDESEAPGRTVLQLDLAPAWRHQFY
jgi:hypothetical protein